MDVSDEEEELSMTSSSNNLLPATDTRRCYEKQLAMYLVLASTFLERIAFYSISANLVFILGSGTQFDWTTTNSSIASLIFSGISYISTLIFAIISDAKLGRFRTINLGFFIYLIGYTFAILIMNPNINKDLCKSHNKTHDQPADTIFHALCAAWILPILAIIAVGAGAVQSNMPVFGIEQVQKPPITSRYFDKHIIALNVSAIIAKSMISYIQDTDHTQIFRGYIVATSMLVAAAIVFNIGRRYYTHIEPYDTVASKCIPVVKNAFQTWRQCKKKEHLANAEPKNPGQLSMLDDVRQSSEQFEDSTGSDAHPSTFLDFAKLVNHGKFSDRIVEDVKSLRSAFIIFGLLIPYWLIYDQLNTSFPAQRQRMKISATEKHPTIISTLVSFGDAGTIILGLIIFNLFLYKYLNARNQSLTITTRFIIGMCFAFITMCTAGILELSREAQCHEDSDNSNLSIYSQLPQNIFMGLSELFVMVASFEFAYFASRRSAQSLFMSLRFFSIGISSFISSIYMATFSKTTILLDFSCKSPKDQRWSFYAYFFILAAVQFIFIIIFILCQKRSRLVKCSFEQVERKHLS